MKFLRSKNTRNSFVKFELFRQWRTDVERSRKQQDIIFSKLSALIIFAITHKLMFTRLFCLIAITFKEKFESLAFFFRPRVVTCKRVKICLSRSKALLIKSNRNICPFVIRHGFLTLKMRTASFLPCIRPENLTPDQHSRRLQNSPSMAEICLAVSVTRDRWQIVLLWARYCFVCCCFFFSRHIRP